MPQVSLDANWALALLTLFLLLATAWYAYEARQSRKVAERTLTELQAQAIAQQEHYLQQHETYLVPSRIRAAAASCVIGLKNIGPGPARGGSIRVVWRDHFNQVHYAENVIRGIPVGDVRSVHLMAEKHIEGINPPDTRDTIDIYIEPQTLLGKKMPVQQYSSSRPSLDEFVAFSSEDMSLTVREMAELLKAVAITIIKIIFRRQPEPRDF